MSLHPIFWNGMGNLGQLSKSYYGVNGTLIGTPLFSSVKFGNGTNMGIADPASNCVRFDNALTPTITNSPFTIELWVKAVKNPINIQQFFQAYNFPTGNPSISCTEYTGTIEYQIFDNAGVKCRYRYSTAGLFTNGEVFHIGMVFDKNAGNQNRIKLYKNNVLLTPYQYFNDSSWNITSNMGITSYFSLPERAIEDSIKVYKYAKTDFGDRRLFKRLRMR